jgi:hypothetical protein
VVNIGNAFVTIDITIKVTDILVLPPEAPKIENQTCNA